MTFRRIFYSMSALLACILLSGCGRDWDGLTLQSGGDGTLDVAETSIPDMPEETEQTSDEENDFDSTYEYYLTRDELLADIEQGYIFRMDKFFHDPAMPTVKEGSWPFYVHEDNILELEIEFSNLFTEWENHKSDSKWLKDMEQMISVKLLSPQGEEVYSYEKSGEAITEDTAVKEDIPVTPGEWVMQISFSYYSRGGDTPSHLKIAAAYREPSGKDIEWLKNNRLER